MCLRDKHRLPEALLSLEHAVALSPALIPAREELADLYGSLDRHADELEQLQVLAGLDRDHVERQVAVGLAEARAGHWDLAVLTLGGALERTPNEPLIYGALGQVWLQRPRDRNDRTNLSKAREALERVVSTQNATSDVLTLYGRALLEDGDANGAEETLQQATTRYPVNPAAFAEYAAAAERQNHFEIARSALIDYDALVSDAADLGVRASSIGALSLRLNDAPAAVTWFERAAAAMPRDTSALAALADAQIRAGEPDAAKATVAKGLEKDPDNAPLQALARRLDTAKAAGAPR
jgi:tetratricopeptide (TPR) repeat protein